MLHRCTVTDLIRTRHIGTFTAARSPTRYIAPPARPLPTPSPRHDLQSGVSGEL